MKKKPEFKGSSKKLNSRRISNPMNKRANELNRQFSKKKVQMANRRNAHHPWP
jgi:hypothetical protein